MGLLTLALGLLYLAAGAVSTLSLIGLKVMELPELLYNETIIKFALLIGAILILFLSFRIREFPSYDLDWSYIIGGVIAFVVGAFPLAIEYLPLDNLPFLPKFTIPTMVLSALLIIFGVFLLVISSKLKRVGKVWGR